MNEINFSVVIPLYNKGNHINRAIDSILNQSHQQFEIIVVDDGSTDNGASYVENYEDSRVKLIKQKNMGVSAARNKGIKNAKYDFIGLLDADDAWKKDFLKEINFLIKDYPNNTAYATSYESYLDEETINKKKFSNMSNEFRGVVDNYFRYSLNGSLISASSVVIKKEVFNKVGFFDESLTHGEDLDMWFRIVLDNDLVFINKVLVIYYRNADNRACNKPPNFSSCFAKKLIENMDFYKLASNRFNQKYINYRLMLKSKNFIFNNEKEYSRQILAHVRNQKKFVLYFCSYIPSNILSLLVKLKAIIRRIFK